jgi:hypothetical protein
MIIIKCTYDDGGDTGTDDVLPRRSVVRSLQLHMNSDTSPMQRHARIYPAAAGALPGGTRAKIKRTGEPTRHSRDGSGVYQHVWAKEVTS